MPKGVAKLARENILQAVVLYVHGSAQNMSLFLQEMCKTCINYARNFMFAAQFLASCKNLVRNLQGARIQHENVLYLAEYQESCKIFFPGLYYKRNESL